MRRCVGKVLLAEVKTDVTNRLETGQTGVGMRVGAEVVVRFVRN